jgi:acyl-coenzyme A synthetase/AMP-(fatty) acid ligase
MEDAQTKLLLLPASGNAAATAAAAGLAIPVSTVELKEDGKTLLVADAAGADKIRLAAPAAAAAAGEGGAAAPAPTPDDVALFLHTSGTTSKPKGVPLTHVSAWGVGAPAASSRQGRGPPAARAACRAGSVQAARPPTPANPSPRLPLPPNPTQTNLPRATSRHRSTTSWGPTR